MKYTRLLTRLYNTPLLIDGAKLDVITSNVTMKLLLGELIPDVELSATEKTETSSSIPIIKVFDSLVAKGGAGGSGYTSYESLKSETLAAIDSGASKIGFYIDSPGGEATGLFAFTAFLSSIPEKYGVETFGFTDGMAASAAYGIAASLQKIYATPSSMTGSIGAMLALVDQTKMDKKKGLKYHILRSEKEKALGNPHEEVTPEILNKFQTMLDNMGVLFHTDVVRNRPNLTLETLKSLKGNTYMGEQALELGLVDSIVSSMDEVIELETKSVTQSTPTLTTIGKSMTLEELKLKLSEADQANLALSAEVATLKAAATQIGVVATTDERTRCTALLASASTLKISAEQVNKRINAGTSADDSLDIFTAIAEATGTATAVDTSVPVQATITEQTTIAAASESIKLEVGGVQTTTAEIMAAVALMKGAK